MEKLLIFSSDSLYSQNSLILVFTPLNSARGNNPFHPRIDVLSHSPKFVKINFEENGSNVGYSQLSRVLKTSLTVQTCNNSLPPNQPFLFCSTKDAIRGNIFQFKSHPS